MGKCNKSSSWIFCASIYFLLIVLLFFSACVQDAPVFQANTTSSIPQSAITSENEIENVTPEVTMQATPGSPLVVSSENLTMTIYSVERVANIGNRTLRPGNIIMMVDATISNNQEVREFRFLNNRIYLYQWGITGKTFAITHKFQDVMENPFPECTIEPGTERRGKIIFAASECSQKFTLFLVDELGDTILSTALPGYGLGEEDDPDSVLQNEEWINVTIHSALKTTKIQNSSPKVGRIFVVVNMTIENFWDYDYSLDGTSMKITDGVLLISQPYLSNPLDLGRIPAHETKSGEVPFSVLESTKSFTLTFYNNDGGRTLLIKELGNIPLGPYEISSKITPLPDNDDFSSTVESLDTAEKAAHFTNSWFTFECRDGCISFSPEEFYRIRHGDCKDYSTFLSYVLAYNGYDAEIVAYRFYDDEGKWHGHVVTMFMDRDGILKYATTPDVTVFREITGIEDLMDQESTRLQAASMGEYRILPAGSVDMLCDEQ
jgi:hypothetical protein